MSHAERLLLAAAALLATVTLAVGIDRTDLWPPNETRVAEISREMLDANNWLVPRLNRKAFLEEPPLFYWIQAGAYRIAGAPSTTAARIPAAAAAILGVLLTVGLARALGTNAAVAALVVATAPEYWWMARTGTPDTANAAATGLALLAFYLAWRSGRAVPLAVAAGAMAVAFWLKSFLGVGLAVCTVVAFLAVAGLGRLHLRQLVWAALVPAAAGAFWLALLAHAQGRQAVSFFVLTNHLGRLVGLRDEGHVRPFYYYVKSVSLGFAPWSIALPAAVLAGWRERASPERLFPLVWAGVMALVLTASASKSSHYLLAAYPAVAVLIAQWWPRAPDGRLDRATWALLGVALLIAVPVATVFTSSLDPATVMPAFTSHRPAVVETVRLFFGTGPGRLAWLTILMVLLGVGFVLARRAGRPTLAVIAAGASAITFHLLIAVVTLPAFNAFVSARSLGEVLGRAARDGVHVVTFRFDNREKVSPFMFYAGRLLPEVKSEGRLERLLFGEGRICAVVPARSYARLRTTFRTLPTAEWKIGRLHLFLVSGTAGGCQSG